MTQAVHITKDVELMLAYAVHAQPELEVGGFAKVEPHKDGIQITDVIIPPQIVGAASVHMGDQIPELGMSGFEWTLVELAKRGETLADWNCWWHSHSRMQTFASDTDQETLKDFAEMLDQRWAVGIVTNTKQEFFCWLQTAQAPWGLRQDKVNITREALPVVKPLADRVTEMMAGVQKAQPLFGAPAVYNRTLNGPRTVTIVWCDTHQNWSDTCRPPHTVKAGNECPHFPNCGDMGCFSKRARKEMKRTRRGPLDIDPDDMDANFDEAFEAAWEDPIYA